MSVIEHAKRKGVFAPLAGLMNPSALAPTNSRADAPFVALVVATFALVAGAGAIYHEMWQDELQAWLIARDSSSLGELFFNLRYEKHPGLWHLCLYFITRLTADPSAMQVLNWVFAVGVVTLFVAFAPFTRLQRLLFSFGYFPLFEYGVISRTYALGVLLVFLFCALFSKTDKNYFALTCVLALLANTSLYGLIVALALGLMVMLHAALERGVRNFSRREGWRIGAGALVLALGVAAALVQIIPPPEGAREVERDALVNAYSKRLAVTRENKDRAVLTLTKVWDSYAPLPNVTTHHFWETNILMILSERDSRRARLILSMLLLGGSLILLARQPAVCASYLAGTAGLLLFSYSIYPGLIRHHGHIFILFIACLWISQRAPRSAWNWPGVTRVSDFLNRYRSGFVAALFCIHLAAGVFAIGMDFLNPFTASKKAAAYLKERGVDDVLLVGHYDHETNFIAAYLGVRAYHLESGDFGSFTVFSKKRKHLTLDGAVEELKRVVAAERRDVLLVLNYPLENDVSPLSVTELARFTGAIVHYENFYVYLIRKKAAPMMDNSITLSLWIDTV
ncbi:MAG TPA: hypothetical protein VM943_12205 [Pyrinomonadaceae bacterium]|nr:hypothetical protein [Pyrinomonadaceae bacterium]